MALGLLHANLFFVWDFLFGLSLLGILLLWFIRLDANRRLKLALWMIGASFFVHLALFGLLWGSPNEWPSEPSLLAHDVAMESGTFAEGVLARFNLWASTQLNFIFSNYGYGCAAMLLGSVAAERRLLEAINPELPMWKAGRLYGLPIGLLLSGLVATPELHFRWINLTFAVAPLFTWGILSLMVLLLSRKVVWLTWLQESGRMSLTCYITESAILLALFAHWGLGLFGKVSTSGSMLVALGVGAILEIFARLWLRRYPRGPIESLVASFLKVVRDEASPNNKKPNIH